MYRIKEEMRPYKALETPELPEDVQNSIDCFLEYLNTSTDGGTVEDCYRAELDSDINWYTNTGNIDLETSKRLKDYYVHGGIYNG